MGKKCTLLDLSRQPSVVEAEVQGVAVLSCTTRGQDSPSTPKPPTDPVTSAEDFESYERKEEEVEKRVNTKEPLEELSADESLAKMEVDPSDSLSGEEQIMKLNV